MALQAEVKLPNYLSDNMIVQRNATLKVSGTAAPGSTVSVTPEWSGKTVKAKAGADGKFLAKVATPEAGGPWMLEVTDGTDKGVTLRNILSGEVWLCAGQSNMEYPTRGWTEVMDADRTIHTAQHPDLRLLHVAKKMAFTPQDNIETAGFQGWQECTPVTVQDFSTVAYHFGKRLLEELKVPVGVIDCSWGGTPAEAWTSYEGICGVPGFEYEADAMKRCNFDAAKLSADYDACRANWMANANKGVKPADMTVLNEGEGWFSAPAGQPFENIDLGANFDGIALAQYAFDVPEELVGQPVKLHLGAIDDEDVTYLNGKEVARGFGCNNPRHYTVPASDVKAGKNILTIRMTDTGGGGGFQNPASDMYVEIGDKRIGLDGNWQYFKAVDFATLPKLPVSVGGSSYPTVLYNAMASPLKNLPIAGTIWYQGCANVGRADQYRPLIKTMVNDWRKLWGENMPFYFVQLAGYLEPKSLQPDSEWAALRDAQTAALELPNTGMAVAIDLGNPGDIHPRNKQDVADRLARLALNDTYGRPTVCRAPELVSLSADGNKLTAKFSGALDPTSVAVTGFIIGDKDGNFEVANGRLQGADTVILSSSKIKNPVEIRYDWADYPGGNLYGADHLPVAPFAKKL